MEAELLIHGPRHAFYGKQEDSQYCQLFDNSHIKDEIRFVVEVRKGANGKWYTYYTYCRYTNVLDVDGRSGAYIGLTIRLNAYYANLRNLYTVLEATFYAKVVGLLVKKSGNSFQYLVGDFKNSQQSILNNVEKSLGTMLAGVITSSEVFPIDSSFSTGGNEIIKGLDDNQYSIARMADVKRTGRLVFASSVEIDKISKLNKEFDLRQQALKDDLQKEVSQIRGELDDANHKNNSLKESLSQKMGQIEMLQNESKQLKDTIESKEKEKSELIDRIESFSSIQAKINQLQNQITQLKTERNDLISKLKASDDTRNKLDVNVQRLEGEIQRLKHTPKSERHGGVAAPKPNNNSFDNSQYAQESQGYTNRVSPHWSFKELGEGLKKGKCFFLIALGVAVCFLFVNYKDDRDSTSAIEKTQPVQKEVAGRQRVFNIPNELTSRMYSDCNEGKTAEKLVINYFHRNPDHPNHFSLQLETPNIKVDEYEWEIKDAKASIRRYEKTKERNLDFRPDSLGTYFVRVFVNDTLIVMKHFEYKDNGN